ncbi:Purple acid phosphatase 23 [Platanthera zijinensis]|uniref:Purple acid phosphatase 23 n=1 Tax=Platanthera zijinensis TaxID=2320716 RepID=A0AAP0GD49_9ASPA
MWISWVTGHAQIGANVKLLDPSSVGSEIWYGEECEKYLFVRNGPAVVYSQMYPFEGLLNYTSGIMHHVRIDGKISQLFFSAAAARSIFVSFLDK